MRESSGRMNWKTRRPFCVAALLAFAVLAPTAEAVQLPIVNYSFEDPNVGSGYAAVAPTGWSGNPGPDVFIENIASVGMTGGDGAQYLGLDDPGAIIWQDLGVPFEAGKTYRVDLASAHRDTYTHETVEFGLFSSSAIGTDLGTTGFMDIQGVWSGSGNPDGDNMFGVFRDASLLQTIGSGALGHTARIATGSIVPAGNVVVFIRNQGPDDLRVNVDNIRVDVIDKPAGDVNGDGFVDPNDFNLIKDNFRKSVAPSLGDLNEDGVVGFDDFREWKDNYPYPLVGLDLSFLNSVPEPSSLVLCGLALSSLACGRRLRRTEVDRQ